MNEKLNYEIMQAINQSQQINNQFKSKAVERSKHSFLINYSLKISESLIFKALIVISVFANTVCLMFDQHPFNWDLTVFFEKMNLYFGCLYLFEMCINLVAYGMKEYLHYNQMNVFDILIVVLSLIDFFVVHLLIMK